MANSNQYISTEQLLAIFADLNVTPTDDGSDILSRATGDLEADLAKKFVVPLAPKAGGNYTDAPAYAQAKVLNAIRYKIREIIGYDKNKNPMLAVESTERFINVFGDQYKKQIKDLLDPMIDYGFQLLSQAQDSQTAVQHIGLARANNRPGNDRGGWDE